MSFEHFPVKEKLATNLESQLAWLVREMGYSRDKTQGYEEKLVRLNRGPEDVQSVFGFMNNYWHRFLIANDGLRSTQDPIMASRALQADAKVVAGLCDKVALALWMEDRARQTPRDSEQVLDSALDMIAGRVAEMDGAHTDEELVSFVGRPFIENPMGQAVLGLQRAYKQDPKDNGALLGIVLEGSATGVLMWQAYARNLETQGYSSVMPRPGLSSGNIEPWE